MFNVSMSVVINRDGCQFGNLETGSKTILMLQSQWQMRQYDEQLFCWGIFQYYAEAGKELD